MSFSFSYNESKIQVLNITSGVICETVQMHSHAAGSYEIHLIIAGKGILDTEDESFTVNKNSLFITGPNIPHKQMPARDFPMNEQCIYLKFLNNCKKNYFLNYFTSHKFWFGKSNKKIRELFSKIIIENENNELLSDHILASLVIQLIVEIVKLYSPNPLQLPENKTHDLNENRAWILDELFLNDCCCATLEDFAENLGVCPRQAERIIFEYYGSTFKKLRYEAKMAKAASLLETGKISVKQCAQMCGYTSTASFANAFKKKFGLTPKEYLYMNRISEYKNIIYI